MYKQTYVQDVVVSYIYPKIKSFSTKIFPYIYVSYKL